MRMRKKKHTVQRMQSCNDILILEPGQLKGTWKEISSGKELCVEIGCGKGSFVVEMAKRNQDLFFIAFEKIPDVIVMAMEKAKHDNLSNVRFICGDAEQLGEIFEQNEVSSIYLNFSDPWPKKKHAKRRLTYRSFLESYRNVIKDGGTIIFKTDNRPLFDFSLTELAAINIPTSDVTNDLHHSEFAAENIMTEYEKIFSEKGFSINRVVGHIIKA